MIPVTDDHSRMEKTHIKLCENRGNCRSGREVHAQLSTHGFHKNELSLEDKNSCDGGSSALMNTLWTLMAGFPPDDGNYDVVAKCRWALSITL